MKEKKLLLIFVKNPAKGRVKTRLAKTVGDEKALKIYMKLLDFTIQVACEADAQKQIWYSSFIDESDGSGVSFKKKLQRGDDLGERMLNAFQQGFEDDFRKIVVIGSDCPGISPEIIDDAFVKLGQEDVVIGPSEDGGYYLLGLKQVTPGIFKDIPWSSGQVLAETLDVLKENQLSYELLPTLNDIDTEEDLRKSDFV